MVKKLAIYGAVFLVGLLLGTRFPGFLAKAPTTLADRITSECESLVDLAHRDEGGDRLASWAAIEAELVKQGAKLPPTPNWDPNNHEASRKAQEERREQMRNLPEYSAAWSTAHDKTLKQGIYECVTIRLAKEGVRR